MSLAPALGAPLSCGTFLGVTAPVRVFDKKPITSTRFRLKVTPIARVVIPSSYATITEQDRVVTRFTGDTLITDYEVAVEYLIPDTCLCDEITFTSSDENKLLVPVNNIARGVNAGSVILKATTSTGEFSAITINVAYQVGTTSDTFIEYSAASTAKNASDAIDTRIAGKAATTKPIYSTQNHGTATYVRNPSCWAADLDLTCISPWNSTGGGQRAGTLISPRHVLFCEHYNFHPAAGATIRFVAADNTVVSRTITALETHPDYMPFYPDITIGVLDSDVPNTIGFAKVLPQNWPTYLPSVGITIAGVTIPALVLDQEEKALVSDWRFSSLLNSFARPTNAQRQVFFETIVTGDSGNPAFLIINNELVVLNTWTYGGAGSGTNLVPHKDAINTMMANLGGGYQLTEVDLSGFVPGVPYQPNYWLPSYDEWYKSAFYKSGGLNAGYWTYATQSDTAPTPVSADSVGNGSAGDTGNYANFAAEADWNGQDGNVTTVGTNGGPSAYGTFDQNGNVWEWNDSVSDDLRGIAGGDWFCSQFRLSTSGTVTFNSDGTVRQTIATYHGNPTMESEKIGFRIASFSNPLSLSNFVDVLDSNNSADVNGSGSVPYLYKMGKYEVTNNDYVEFLNSIAQTDTHGVYSESMGVVLITSGPDAGSPSPNQRGGITRSGVAGSYSYSAKANMGNKPVNFVSWYSAARYCNWLHNGKPSGLQNISTTEDGVYALLGAATGIILKRQS